MAQTSLCDCLQGLPQWTPLWEEAVRALECNLETKTGKWYHTRVGRLWRAVGPRERRALILIAMANSRRPSEGRIIDEASELLVAVCKYFDKVEIYSVSEVRKAEEYVIRRPRRTEGSLRIYLQRRRLAQKTSLLVSRAALHKRHEHIEHTTVIIRDATDEDELRIA